MSSQVLLLGHGDLPTALYSSAELIGAPTGRATLLGLYPGDGITEFIEKVQQALDPAAQEILICTDLAGGTPTNAARYVQKTDARVSVVTNINLPLLLEILLSEGELSTAELAEACELAKAEVIPASGATKGE